MKKLIFVQKAQVADQKSAHHGQRVSLLFEDHTLVSIWPEHASAPESAEVINAANAFIGPSWIDLQAYCGEPGFELRDTFESLKASAAAGGFGHVLVMPNAENACDKAAIAEMIVNRNRPGDVQLYPIGALCLDMKNEHLADLADLAKHGALAFTHAKKSMRNSQLMMVAMQYAASLGVKVFWYPEDEYLSQQQGVTQGVTALTMGMKGDSPLAESIQVSRAIAMAEYLNLPLHLSNISLADSLRQIEAAKAKGIAIRCTTNLAHISLNEHKLENFDAAFKFLPPLRAEADRVAMIDGIAQGTIDALVSDHQGRTLEEKELEFGYAAHGSLALEAFAGQAWQCLKNHLTPEAFMDKMSYGSAALVSMPVNSIAIGTKGPFTLFFPNQNGIFEASHLMSLSKNCAYIGLPYQGKARLVG